MKASKTLSIGALLTTIITTPTLANDNFHTLINSISSNTYKFIEGFPLCETIVLEASSQKTPQSNIPPSVLRKATRHALPKFDLKTLNNKLMEQFNNSETFNFHSTNQQTASFKSTRIIQDTHLDTQISLIQNNATGLNQAINYFDG